MKIQIAVSLILGLFLGNSLVAQGAELKGSRPNIVLVITDDQGYGPVGKHGHPWLKTPHLDQLFDQSVRFTRFLVSPTCSPTRSALMTGRHPMKNGITHTILERERMTLAATTLPQVLKTVKYQSGIFGKWHLGDEEEYQPHRRGFDEAFIHGAGGIGQAYACSCADVPQNSYFDPVVRHNGSFVKTKGFCTDVFFTGALAWIKEVKERDDPFFAYIATNAPHGPFLAKPENKARFLDAGFSEQEAGFYGMIENIDENLGRLLSHLEKWQLLQNTVVIFMSDNGMTGGGSGKLGKPMGKSPTGTPMLPYNADMKGLKGSVDEGGVRVPFFVRWDGHVKAGRDIETVAAHLDVLPTLAELAGASLPTNQVEGRSLVPFLEGKPVSWKDRFLFTHTGRWNTGENPDDYQWKNFAVRNQRFRLTASGKSQELFDMQEDPQQTTDVSDQHPEVVKEMLAAYEQFWKEARPLMVNESAPMSPTRPFHELYEKQLAGPGIPDWKPPVLED